MEFTKLSFELKDGVDTEIVSALLQYHGAEALWEDGQLLHAYFEDARLEEVEALSQIVEALDSYINNYIKSKDQVINWNKEWESNFDPVEVDRICFIYADFHKKKDGFENYIRIAPKMAFGTGHHETTFMMIQAMRNLDLEGKRILDLGCGTGILAVYAMQRGANEVDAIDIEVESVENSREHALLNQVGFNVLHGSVENVPDKKYDVVLANINRHVLLSYSKEIINMLSADAELLISGILLEDEGLIKEAYKSLAIVDLNRKGKWTCFHFSK